MPFIFCPFRLAKFGQIMAIKNFVKGPFVALAKAVDLAPSDPFFDFSFPSYGRFREGDPPTQQKVLPHPTVPVTALACSAGKMTFITR